jgi:hypothetical protein
MSIEFLLKGGPLTCQQPATEYRLFCERTCLPLFLFDFQLIDLFHGCALQSHPWFFLRRGYDRGFPFNRMEIEPL